MLSALWMYMCGCVHVCVCLSAFSLYVPSVIYGTSLSAGWRGVSRCLHFPNILNIYCQQMWSSCNYSQLFFYCLLSTRDACCITDKQLVLDSNKGADWCLHDGRQCTNQNHAGAQQTADQLDVGIMPHYIFTEERTCYHCSNLFRQVVKYERVRLIHVEDFNQFHDSMLFVFGWYIIIIFTANY